MHTYTQAERLERDLRYLHREIRHGMSYAEMRAELRRLGVSRNRKITDQAIALWSAVNLTVINQQESTHMPTTEQLIIMAEALQRDLAAGCITLEQCLQAQGALFELLTLTEERPCVS